ncbi:ribose-phosphate diphosphokinase [Methylotuvimicrobium sp.]|uniref:ribose-phosphate diphosphokinase n=1 Tax=Methylotuvimicrobium sp. TaxID=2822413 RepID=UPI003D654BCB
MLILAFPDYCVQAERLACRLDSPFELIGLHRFPDGESLVRLPAVLPDHVIVCRSLDRPNDKLVELMLFARTARELGAKRVTLVTPYLCYMRQDIANRPGEAVSQRIVGRLLADLFDDVLTVDPHLHRISHLNQAIPLANAVCLSAAGAIGDYLSNQFDDAILLGPDSESEQWVSGIAAQIGFDYAVADKIRRGDREVEVTLPDKEFKDKLVVIIDDMASTGRTLARTIGLLQNAGARTVYAAITHPLFCGDAEAHIRAAGVKEIWSTDSIEHPTSCIKLDALLSEAVRSIL